jgi:hypothetical protein
MKTEAERMITRHPKTDVPGNGEKEKSVVNDHAAADRSGDCRCKETSKMSPRELLELMMKDLAFWKKEKKG